jgi:hypothetical protein
LKLALEPLLVLLEQLPLVPELELELELVLPVFQLVPLLLPLLVLVVVLQLRSQDHLFSVPCPLA